MNPTAAELIEPSSHRQLQRPLIVKLQLRSPAATDWHTSALFSQFPSGQSDSGTRCRWMPHGSSISCIPTIIQIFSLPQGVDRTDAYISWSPLWPGPVTFYYVVFKLLPSENLKKNRKQRWLLVFKKTNLNTQKVKSKRTLLISTRQHNQWEFSAYVAFKSDWETEKHIYNTNRRKSLAELWHDSANFCKGWD